MPESAPTNDAGHLARALVLAALGAGAVSPNPLVGCVIARGDSVIGEGFHAELGGLHAERAALADCARRGNDPAGATCYVTLEPCAHTGRQPPCADALIEARVARVVYASADPSATASGRGPERLRAAGIAVEEAGGPVAADARLLNQPFRRHARTGLPLVTLKSALSLDGRTATAAGDSKWISGSESRALVHAWRAESDLVAVGIGTVLADDPLLTARDAVRIVRQPRRVVFDSAARLPRESALLGSLDVAPLTVVVAANADRDRVAGLRGAGAEVLTVAGGPPAARVLEALATLGAAGASSLLLEGGATLAGAFREAGEIDRLELFVAPIVIGDGVPLMRGGGASGIAEATRALAVESRAVGDDVLISARLREW